jgi:hypothetical protein
VNAPPARWLVQFADRIDLAAHHAGAATAVGNQLPKLEATAGSLAPKRSFVSVRIVVIGHFADSNAAPKHEVLVSPRSLGFCVLTV